MPQRNTGALLEGLLDLIFRSAEQEGEAWVRRTHPGTGIDASGRRFFKGAGAPDYMGVLRGGRMFVAEAKSTIHTRWAWPEGMGRRVLTKRRQIDDLTTAGRLGALSGVIIFFQGADPSLVWVPWQNVERVALKTWTAPALHNEAGGVAWIGNPDAGAPIFKMAQDLDRRLTYQGMVEGVRVP